MTQLKDGGRQPGNREERSLSASTVIARRQGNGWDEPCKLRGLRTVLWAAGGEIPPADPAPTQLDRQQFINVITSFSKEELEKRHPLIRRKYARRPEPRPRMVEAYLFFY